MTTSKEHCAAIQAFAEDIMSTMTQSPKRITMMWDRDGRIQITLETIYHVSVDSQGSGGPCWNESNGP